MDKRVRVRFAPSPTGPLHIGGVRTALYNYLFAKKHGGDFILRIEDTDEKRYVKGAEKYITESLKWLGIEPDECDAWPNPKGSPYDGVYRQSDRATWDTYSRWAHQLVEDGHAYYAFDTSEELDAKREEYTKAGQTFKYDYISRDSMKNSIVLSAEVVEDMMMGTPYVIRLKVPRNQDIRFHDSIRGWIIVNSNTLDDKVLMKETNSPTYHLASIVDDHDMEISHVIRGEEWLPSAPLHVLMYNMLGWDVPEFVHLPLIMGPKGKLSKRDGDKYGFPVYPLAYTDPETGDVSRGYREDGFLPEAVLNIVALLGWNPGNNIEFMTLKDMEESFTLDRVQKGGAKFDLVKAEWMNREHMRAADNDTLADLIMDDVDTLCDFDKTGISFNKDYVAKVCGLLKERTLHITKFVSDGKYFFRTPIEYDFLSGVVTAEMLDFLDEFIHLIHVMDENNFNHDSLKPVFDAAIEKTGIKPRNAGKVLRGAICDNKVGPSIFDIMNVIGKYDVHFRLVNACGLRQVLKENAGS